MRLLVVQPDAKCDLHRMGLWLAERGIAVRVVRPFAGDVVPGAVDGDGLIVLGGAMGALDDQEFPYLADTKRLLRRAVANDVPTLGICLGAQLLAAALGGEVERGDAGLECGVVSVEWLDSAQDDALTRGLVSPFPVASLHFDAVTRLPPGAVLLGTGDVYPNQVFRVGSAWGVQFHPEISPDRFRSWRSEVPEHIHAAYDRLASAFDLVEEEVGTGARTIIDRFLGVVMDSPAVEGAPG